MTEVTPQGSMAGIRLTEALPKPELRQEEWIELYNMSETPVTLAGFLDDAEGGSDPWLLPAIAVAPGEHRVFSGSLTRLRLNDGGDHVRLLALDGSILDEMVYGSMLRNATYARPRLEDGLLGVWCMSGRPTPGGFGPCGPVSITKTSSSKKATAKKPAKKPVVKARVVKASSSAITRSDVLAMLTEPDPPPPASSGAMSVWWMLLFLPGNAVAGYLGTRMANGTSPFISV